MQTLKKVGVTIMALALPLVASAQGLTRIQTIMTSIRTILNVVIYIMFALLIIYFIWGVVQYVSAGGDEEKLKNGKRHMLWGIIGIAVVGAIFGIAQWLWTEFGVGTGTPQIPQF